MNAQVKRLLAGEAQGMVFLDERGVGRLIDAVLAVGGRAAEVHGPAGRDQLLAAIGSGLCYPDWWGRNWDALAEMLSFPEPSDETGPLSPDVPEAIIWRDPATLAARDPAAWEMAGEILEEAIADRRERGMPPLIIVLTGDLPADSDAAPDDGHGRIAPRAAVSAPADVPAPVPAGTPAMAVPAAALHAVPSEIRRIGRVHHLAVIVREMDAALRFWRDVLGLAPGPVVPIPSDRVNIAFLPVGEVRIELVEPTDDTTGVARFLAKKGEGFHHVCFEVPDINAALTRLAIDGIELIDTAGRPGAEGPVAFLHPKSCHGVLVELIEAEGGPAWATLYPSGFRAPGA